MANCVHAEGISNFEWSMGPESRVYTPMSFNVTKFFRNIYKIFQNLHDLIEGAVRLFWVLVWNSFKVCDFYGCFSQAFLRFEFVVLGIYFWHIILLNIWICEWFGFNNWEPLDFSVRNSVLVWVFEFLTVKIHFNDAYERAFHMLNTYDRVLRDVRIPFTPFFW